MNQNEPVISFIIISYNSAEFILETLNSAKHQTYQNIELIISDDNSSDETIPICEKWLSENNSRFVRTEIVKSIKNTGTSANLNRGMAASTGKWIKFLAGDDYLYPNCIETFIAQANTNPEIKFIFSNTTTNGEETENNKLLRFFSLANKEQYRELLKNSILPAPTCFINREVLENLNGFDERFKLLEDYPFFLKASKSGVRFFHINKPLVFYRVHETNISLQQKLNLNYIDDVRRFSHYSLQYLLLKLATLGIIRSLNTYNSLLNWLSFLNWKLRFEKLLTRQ